MQPRGLADHRVVSQAALDSVDDAGHVALALHEPEPVRERHAADDVPGEPVQPGAEVDVAALGSAHLGLEDADAVVDARLEVAHGGGRIRGSDGPLQRAVVGLVAHAEHRRRDGAARAVAHVEQRIEVGLAECAADAVDARDQRAVRH